MSENMTDQELTENLLNLLKEFNGRGLGNPFNYNRAFEYLQADLLGFNLTKVGGGSDGVNDEGITAEFKATVYKGTTKKGIDKSHSFSYNGTSRKDNLEEQEKYCRQKIMRDPFHYWTIINYDNGTFVKTLKVPAETVWKLLWPKWKNSFDNPSASDPRIGGSVSTNDLKGEEFEVIRH